MLTAVTRPSDPVDTRVFDLPRYLSVLPLFSDLSAHELERLAATARRHVPDKANLFIALDYDRAAWDRVQHGIEGWARR